MWGAPCDQARGEVWAGPERPWARHLQHHSRLHHHWRTGVPVATLSMLRPPHDGDPYSRRRTTFLSRGGVARSHASIVAYCEGFGSVGAKTGAPLVGWRGIGEMRNVRNRYDDRHRQREWGWRPAVRIDLSSSSYRLSCHYPRYIYTL